MNADRPVILAVLFLAAGLGLIFLYGINTTSVSMGYPFSVSNLHLAIRATGPVAAGGFALTTIGLLLLVWAFIWATIGEIGLISPARNVSKRHQRAEQQERMDREDREERKQLQQRIDDLK